MGGVPSFQPFIIVITIILIGPCFVAEANRDTKETHPPPILRPDDDNGGIATTSPTVSASHSRHRRGKKTEPLKPSTVIVVCVLTTLFSITFILLLYIKHCIAGDTFILSNPNSLGATQSSSEERKNSGVDRAVVESLPIFRFGSLRGQKEGLDCAVCLTRFEDSEVLRLLPKCNHAFHVECVDTWLHAHSTCPLCRHNIDPEDITLVDRHNNHNEALDIIQRETNTTQPGLRNRNQRVSGRHSSVGEFLRNTETTSSFRRSSFDSAGSRKMKGMRKDGMLLLKRDNRLEHRIIVSPTKSQCGGVHQQRWSNVEPSDLLYLTSEMIISDSPSSSSLSSQQQHQSMRLPLLWNTRGGGRGVRNRNVDDEMEKGGMVNLRSVSEATGMSRFPRNGNRNRGGKEMSNDTRERLRGGWLGFLLGCDHGSSYQGFKSGQERVVSVCCRNCIMVRISSCVRETTRQ